MPKSPKFAEELYYELILFFVTIATIILVKSQFFAATALLIYWFIGYKVWHKAHDITFFLTGLSLITIIGIVVSGVGLWTFSQPATLGIPLWFPFFGGILAVLIVRIAETFVEIEEKN